MNNSSILMAGGGYNSCDTKSLYSTWFCRYLDPIGIKPSNEKRRRDRSYESHQARKMNVCEKTATTTD